MGLKASDKTYVEVTGLYMSKGLVRLALHRRSRGESKSRLGQKAEIYPGIFGF